MTLPRICHWHLHADGVLRVYRSGQLVLELGPDDPPDVLINLSASLLEAAAKRVRLTARGEVG
jgi:hypothetical protein